MTPCRHSWIADSATTERLPCAECLRERVAELAAMLGKAVAALERVATVPCDDARCTEAIPCRTHVARDALAELRRMAETDAKGGCGRG